METSEADIQYFLVIDGEKCGPLRLAELIDAGMDQDTLVWWQGLESWPRAGKIPKLAALLVAERRRRQAARRAERLPTPEAVRHLGRFCLLANLPAAAMFLVSGTLLLTALVLAAIAENSAGPPPAAPSDHLLRIAWWLCAAGLFTTVLGLPLLILEAVFLGRLVWLCRFVVRTAAPSHRDDSMSLDLGDLTELGNVDIGGPSLPTFDTRDAMEMVVLLVRPGGRAGLHVGLAVLVVMFFVTVLPVIFCLLRPQMVLQMIVLAVLLAIYAAVHLPVVITMLLTVYRSGYSLNQIIDLYRLYEVKVPWAPIALGFWTAACAGLLLAGPFSLAFFILLGLWAWRMSATAAKVCEPDARELLSVPLPAEPAQATAPRDGGSWSEAARRS